MNARDEFIGNVRKALGRGPDMAEAVFDDHTSLFDDSAAVEERARRIVEEAQRDGHQLMAMLEESAAEAGWQVARAKSPAAAGGYIRELASRLGARSVVRSRHSGLDQIDLGPSAGASVIEVTDLFAQADDPGPERDGQREVLRKKAIAADIGVTGVDYAIAETGTAVVVAGPGVSRLVSLLPPVYVAVVRRGQVLPSLDELFTLRRRDFLGGAAGGYMNLITGPSRTADIEYTLVTGVHGPGEVHMVLVQ